MNELLIGKALIAVEVKNPNDYCSECYFHISNNADHCALVNYTDDLFPCRSNYRQDEKNVMYKMIDLPSEVSDE